MCFVLECWVGMDASWLAGYDCKFMQELELPYYLEKSDDEKENAWAHKDLEGRHRAQIAFRLLSANIVSDNHQATLTTLTNWAPKTGTGITTSTSP